jgi:hypothetical protein
MTFTTATESTPLKPRPATQVKEVGTGTWFAPTDYPHPLTLTWRAAHCAAYLTAGCCFVVGSLCYFPSIANYSLGGWSFTIGSVGFLYADLLEWWTNNRVGCFDSAHLRAQFDAMEAMEAQTVQAEAVGVVEVGPEGELNCKEAEEAEREWELETEPECIYTYTQPSSTNGLNFFYSAVGSALYLWGSVLYIPRDDGILQGTELFIVGSVVIATSQSWKLYRYPSFTHDLGAVHVDSGALVGGLLYLVGSVLFLPQVSTYIHLHLLHTYIHTYIYTCLSICLYSYIHIHIYIYIHTRIQYITSDSDTARAAFVFTLGGASFAYSGVAMFYRYFLDPGKHHFVCGFLPLLCFYAFTVCNHLHIHTYIHTYIHLYLLILLLYIHIHGVLLRVASIYLYTYTHTHIYTYMYTYIHTYTHTACFLESHQQATTPMLHDVLKYCQHHPVLFGRNHCGVGHNSL